MSEKALPQGDKSSREPGDDDLIGGGKIMSVFDHLGELRTRIVRSLMAVVILFVIAFSFAERIIGFLKQPLMAVLPESAGGLHFTGPMDVFLVDIKVAFLTAVVCACPIWIYQFWKFFEPALYPKERRYILPFVFVSALLFFAGVSFCYFVILPMTLEFLIGMGMEVGTPIITITDYVSLLTLLIFGFGIVFEFPVIVVLLALLDIISVEMLTEYRRFVIVAILVIAAVMTPPDPISQIALTIPVYAMYEIAILVIRLVKKKPQTKDAAA